jgi:hypothetical protein
MRVFISWSGATSRHVAEALRVWLPNVVFEAEPFLSQRDIRAGHFWDESLRTRLRDAKFAIACVTPENQRSQWLNYEAGAMAEGLGIPVAPYLIGLVPEQLDGPLRRLQAKSADPDGTWSIVESLWDGRSKLKPEQLRNNFDKNWADLELKLNALPTAGTMVEPDAGSPELGYIPRDLDDDSVVHLLQEKVDFVGNKETLIFAELEKSLRLPPGSARRLLPRAVPNDRFELSMARDTARVARKPKPTFPSKRGSTTGGF